MRHIELFVDCLPLMTYGLKLSLKARIEKFIILRFNLWLKAEP